MKRCPTCNRTFTERELSFCIDDGTPLVAVSPHEQPTIRLPDSRVTAGQNAPPDPAGAGWKRPDYQPPGSHQPRATGRRRVWPWLLGILGVLLLGVVGLGVAAAIFLPRMLAERSSEYSSNRNDNASNVNVAADHDTENQNANANSNPAATDSNANTNSNSSADDAAEDLSPPPSDRDEVLGDLKDLENEWTIANINADKKALDRILADDYVGTTDDGKPQGKGEYLRTVRRDTSIEKWNFDDLRVTLKGDRATLTGVVTFVVIGQELPYRFVDKFVWRDGRWQATGSEVNQMKK